MDGTKRDRNDLRETEEQLRQRKTADDLKTLGEPHNNTDNKKKTQQKAQADYVDHRLLIIP